MTTTVKADNRSRIVLRGAEDGKQYTVSEQAGGWFVQANTRVRRQGLSGAAFAKLWKQREALDAETAAEVAGNIQKTKKAT